MPVQTQLQQRRGTAASWTSTNPTLAAGEIGFETDTGKFKIGNGSTAWAALAYTAAATAVTYLFNATSGQTTFSGADANGLTLAYTVGAEQVYLNGVLQVRGSDYTATNGTSIVLASGALTSDVLNVIAYSAMTVTDTYTQAQADAKFVQQTNNFFAGKNKVINGDFGIWQRGTSFSNVTSGTYTADRWVIPTKSGTHTTNVTQQTFTPGTAPVAGYESTNFMQIATTGYSSGDYYLAQKIEDVRTFAGQTVTFSYWARVTSGTLTPTRVFLNQNFGSGGSAEVDNIGNAAPTYTTTWTRYTSTISVPSIAGKTIGTGSFLYVLWQFTPTSNPTVQIWGVQLEAGSIATPFQTATGTLAGELAACQRYFNRFSSANNAYNNFSTGNVRQTGAGAASYFNFFYPVEMRIAPTAVTTANITSCRIQQGGTDSTVTSAEFDGSTTKNGTLLARATIATAGTGTLAANNSTAVTIDWSAEL